MKDLELTNLKSHMTLKVPPPRSVFELEQVKVEAKLRGLVDDVMVLDHYITIQVQTDIEIIPEAMSQTLLQYQNASVVNGVQKALGA
jgi:hypothetical protein